MVGQIIKNDEMIKLIKSRGTVHNYKSIKILASAFILLFF